MENIKDIIESLLFISKEPLTIKRIRTALPFADAGKIYESLQALGNEYDARGGGFYLREVAGGYQMRTRPEYKDWIKRLVKSSPPRLSKSALETLAIIAWNQPIIRSEIERIRGVDSGGIVRALLERNLVRVLGRKEIPGRPLIYATTKQFLEVFDLKSLKDLPSPKEIEELGAATLEEETAGPPNETDIPDHDGETADTRSDEIESPKSDDITAGQTDETPPGPGEQKSDEAEQDRKTPAESEEAPASIESDQMEIPGEENIPSETNIWGPTGDDSDMSAIPESGEEDVPSETNIWGPSGDDSDMSAIPESGEEDVPSETNIWGPTGNDSDMNAIQESGEENIPSETDIGEPAGDDSDMDAIPESGGEKVPSETNIGETAGDDSDMNAIPESGGENIPSETNIGETAGDDSDMNAIPEPHEKTDETPLETDETPNSETERKNA